MDMCQWVDCTVPLKQTGRGRPRQYCEEHAASTAANKKRWIPNMESYDQCCLDWQASAPRRRVCPQHQQWRRFCQDVNRPVLYRPKEYERLLTLFDTDVDSRNFRISPNPDSFEARLQAREINYHLRNPDCIATPIVGVSCYLRRWGFH